MEFEHNGTLHRNTASFAMRFVPEDRLRFVYAIKDQRWSFGPGDDRARPPKLKSFLHAPNHCRTSKWTHSLQRPARYILAS